MLLMILVEKWIKKPRLHKKVVEMGLRETECETQKDLIDGVSPQIKPADTNTE